MADRDYSGDVPARMPELSRRHLLNALAATPVVAVVPAGLSQPLAELAPSQHPDAELFELERQIKTVLQRINNNTLDIDFNNDPDWNEKMLLEEEILDSQPKTLDGVAVMLRVLCENMFVRTNPDGSPKDGYWNELALWRILKAAEGRNVA